MRLCVVIYTGMELTGGDRETWKGSFYPRQLTRGSSPLLSSPLLWQSRFFMNECMAVCPRCLLFECELAWCYEGDGDFFAFGGAVVCCFACLCLLDFSSFSCVGILACCGRSSGAVCVASCPSPFSSSECVILTGRYSIRMAGCCWIRGIASIGGGQGVCCEWESILRVPCIVMNGSLVE